MVKVLELFAGSRSIGKAAESLGYEVFSVDIKRFDGIDLVKDIEHLWVQDIPFKPTILWASPPCTTYSIAAVSTHRNGQTPKTPFARKSDRLVKNVIRLARRYNCIYYIENPRGMLRKMDFMQTLPRATITYCKYATGDEMKRMKPTDIWTNNLRSLMNPNGWEPKPMCKNGDPCHEPAPRGSKTGTQGLKGNYERSKIPEQLCKEILEASIG